MKFKMTMSDKNECGEGDNYMQDEVPYQNIAARKFLLQQKTGETPCVKNGRTGNWKVEPLDFSMDLHKNEMKSWSRSTLPSAEHTIITNNHNSQMHATNIASGERMVENGMSNITNATNSLNLSPQEPMSECSFSVAHTVDKIEPQEPNDLTTSNRTEKMVRDGEYWRGVMLAEKFKLEKMCMEWNNILDTRTDLNEEAEGLIRSALGHGTLLTTKRFKQYSDMCDISKDKTAALTAGSVDLEGFWDVIYMQVEDLQSKFQELDDLKAKNWVEVAITPRKALPPSRTKLVKKAPVVDQKAAAAAAERIKQRNEARQKLMEVRKQAMKLRKEEEAKAKAMVEHAILDAKTPPQERHAISEETFGSKKSFAVVTPSRRMREYLGTDNVITPVRRSTRHGLEVESQKRGHTLCFDDVDDIPNSGELGYVPNPSL
eukprot:CFRG5758T1